MTSPDLAGRLAKVRAEIERLELDGMLLTKLQNVRWLSGFAGSNGTVVVTPDKLILITDSRYQDQAPTQTAMLGDQIEIQIGLDAAGVVKGAFGRWASPTRLGFEAHYMSVEAHSSMVSSLGRAKADWEPLVATSGLIERLRQEKDQSEIECLGRAAAIADAAFKSTWPQLHQRPSEREFAAALGFEMRQRGADGLSFDTIVASGPNAALPHAVPGDRIVEAGDLVVLDFGAAIDGYGSDMTRTVVAGGEPTTEQQELYDAVAVAQQAGVAAVGDGVPEADVDWACRSSLEASGFGDAFTHGTGHGIGLEIHESPILSARSVGILRTGLVITVEPGAYLPGFGGVRVEDSVVVTASGCRPITHSPKGLVPQFS